MSDPPINCSIFPKALQQNIKVAIRVKPLLDEQLARGQEDSPSASGGIAQDSCCVSIHSPVSLSVNSAKSVKDFTFDSIYGPDASQADVYGIVSDLVEKAIEGYNVCIFAYGQTGAGKTHTMSMETGGIISQVASQLFSSMTFLTATKSPSSSTASSKTALHSSTTAIPKSNNIDGNPPFQDEQEEETFSLHASFLEIYQEKLKDLFLPPQPPLYVESIPPPELRIRKDPFSTDPRALYIPALQQREITSPSTLSHLLVQAQRNKTVAATLMNATSSRAHSILTLTVTRKSPRATRTSKLHLIDLAGSERQDKTGATGIRLREAGYINTSLSALGNVISILSSSSLKEGDHVPFRDSKLTYLLSDSLGGNALVLLLACISNDSAQAAETLSTLRFAERAKKIKNQARVNLDLSALRILELEELVALLRRECRCGAVAAILAGKRKVENHSNGGGGGSCCNHICRGGGETTDYDEGRLGKSGFWRRLFSCCFPKRRKRQHPLQHLVKEKSTDTLNSAQSISPRAINPSLQQRSANPSSLSKDGGKREYSYTSSATSSFAESPKSTKTSTTSTTSRPSRTVNRVVHPYPF